MKSIVTRLSAMAVSLALLNLMFAIASDARIRIDDVVGMWLFDEIIQNGPRRIVKDSSNRGHDGVVVGNPESAGDPRLVDGRIGKALAFGKGRYIEVPDHDDWRLTDVISISVWVKRPLPKDANDLGLAPFYILEKGGFWGHNQLGVTNYGLAVHKILDNMVYFFYKGGLRGANGIQDDDWHHYAVIAKEGAMSVSIYVDGELRPDKVKNGQERVQLFPSNRSLHIGALLPERFDSYSETIIDEVIIFKTALSADDVGQLRGGFFAVYPAGKVATTWGEIKQGQ